MWQGTSPTSIQIQATEVRLEPNQLSIGEWRATRGAYPSISGASFTISGQGGGALTGWANLSLPVPLTMLHNTSSAHAMVSFLGEATHAAWVEAHANSSRPQGGNQGGDQGGAEEGHCTDTAATPYYSLQNDPLPQTRQQSLQVKLILSVLSALFMLVPFCYIPASAAVFVIKARHVSPLVPLHTVTPRCAIP